MIRRGRRFGELAALSVLNALIVGQLILSGRNVA